MLSIDQADNRTEELLGIVIVFTFIVASSNTMEGKQLSTYLSDSPQSISKETKFYSIMLSIIAPTAFYKQDGGGFSPYLFLN